MLEGRSIPLLSSNDSSSFNFASNDSSSFNFAPAPPFSHLFLSKSDYLPNVGECAVQENLFCPAECALLQSNNSRDFGWDGCYAQSLQTEHGPFSSRSPELMLQSPCDFICDKYDFMWQADNSEDAISPSCPRFEEISEVTTHLSNEGPIPQENGVNVEHGATDLDGRWSPVQLGKMAETDGWLGEVERDMGESYREREPEIPAWCKGKETGPFQLQSMERSPMRGVNVLRHWPRRWHRPDDYSGEGGPNYASSSKEYFAMTDPPTTELPQRPFVCNSTPFTPRLSMQQRANSQKYTPPWQTSTLNPLSRPLRSRFKNQAPTHKRLIELLKSQITEVSAKDNFTQTIEDKDSWDNCQPEIVTSDQTVVCSEARNCCSF